MTINNPRAYMAGIWDWGIFGGCFGQSRVRPMDIDGYLERRGRKLFIETKAPGVELPKAQFDALHSLVDDGHTVMLLWGRQNQPERMRLITPHCDFTEDVDLDRVQAVVSQWYAWADRTHNQQIRHRTRAAAKAQVDDRPF